jgi:hypothetical protein
VGNGVALLGNGASGGTLLGAGPRGAPGGWGCGAAPLPVFTNVIIAKFNASQETTFSMLVANHSPLTASCNYEAISLNPLAPSDTTRTFTVEANNSDTERFSGLKTGTQYKITLTCNDATGKQTEPLGSVIQTVTW